MVVRLYLTPLPEAQAQSADEGVQARVDVQGLLDKAGVAAEAIATDAIDLTVSGQFRYGPVDGAAINEKLARELESLSESSYSAVPLLETGGTSERDGYYEVQSVDVNRAQPNSGAVREYQLNLTVSGTRRTHWRAVDTNVETVNTGLATGSGGQFGIPATASKARWWDVGSGTESATVQSTVTAEFGDVDLFDPTEPTFDNPMLIYEQPYDGEGEVDVRVWDDRGLSKTTTVSGGGSTVSSSTLVGSSTVETSYDVTQWRHVFHTSAEYEGSAVVDNGRLRVRFDEANGHLEAAEWNNSEGTWDVINVSHGDYDLFDVDLTQIGPARTAVFTEWTDTTDGSIDAAVLHFERGLDGCVVRDPANGDVPSALETVLDPVATDQTTDAMPAQTVKARSDVR